MINKKYGIGPKQIEKYGFKLCLEIYNKYNRECSICKTKDRLAIHHIDFSGQTDSPNNTLDNLQLICIKCHCSLHTNKRNKERAELNGGYRWKGREKEHQREYSQMYNTTLTEEKRQKTKERNRLWMMEYNKSEKGKEYIKKYYQEHKEECREKWKERCKKYYLENKEKWKKR